MTHHTTLKTLISTMALLVVLGPAAAQTSADIDICRTTTDRVRRLICFDTLFKTPASIAQEVISVPPAPAPAASPLRQMALAQEREREDGASGAVTRMRPWRSASFFKLDAFNDILAGKLNIEPAGTASKHEWTAQTTDVFLTFREADIAAPPSRSRLEDRAVMMLTCENDITGFYILLPQTVKSSRTKFVITTDRGMTFNLRWRDFEYGDVILAGRGLESIDLIKSLSASRRLSLQIDHADTPHTYVFDIDKLAEQLRPLRHACHW